MGRYGISGCVMVLLVALAAGPAMAQTTQPAALSGTIFRVMDGGFVMVDKTGAPVTVTVAANTNFLMKKAASNFQEVVRPGMRVKVTAAPDGTTGEITGSGLASQLNTKQLQLFLGATDDEWAVLKPRIDKIQALDEVATGQGSGNGNGPTPPSATAVDTAEKALRDIFYSRDATSQNVQAAVNNLRAARARLQAELDAARDDLTGLVTPQQEMMLVVVGVLK